MEHTVNFLRNALAYSPGQRMAELSDKEDYSQTASAVIDSEILPNE